MRCGCLTTAHGVAGMEHSFRPTPVHVWMDAPADAAADIVLGASIDAGATLDAVESACGR